MRALFKEKNKDVMIEVKKVEYDICLNTVLVCLYNKNVFVCIRVPIHDTESIKVGFLRNGYYDFREYETSTSKF